MKNNNSVIRITDLTKSFGQAQVLKGINLQFRRGEIHAFVGANGAGKSTLLGCLSGALAPSSGRITVNGTPFKSLTPRQANRLGIGIIYQHFQVIEGLTVADNIFLGSEIKTYGTVCTAQQNQQAAKLLERLGVALNPQMFLEKLSIGEQQIVEIARALHYRPDVLILDEPTAALSDNEMSALHQVVRQLARQENLAIVYVTHLLDEIQEIADIVTVLRDGEIIWTRPVAKAPTADIAKAIAPEGNNIRHRQNSPDGSTARLSLEEYHSDYTGPVNLHLYAGEIIGLYGLLGSGRTDLLESIAGARPRNSGHLYSEGKSVAPATPGEALSQGIALVASDRKEQSIFGTLPALDNLLMPHFSGIADTTAKQHSLFNSMAERLSLKPANARLEGGRFSGGNAQKLVMGRWLIPNLSISVLLLDEPTQGVDIGAREELYRLMDQFTESGGAILLASSDPGEIIAVSDSILVLAEGRQIAFVQEQISEEELVHIAHQTLTATRENTYVTR